MHVTRACVNTCQHIARQRAHFVSARTCDLPLSNPVAGFGQEHAGRVPTSCRGTGSMRSTYEYHGTFGDGRARACIHYIHIVLLYNMCIHIYIYIYICMYVCMYIYIYIHIYIYIYIYIHVRRVTPAKADAAKRDKVPVRGGPSYCLDKIAY